MREITISVAKDFTRFPAGRYVTDGAFSGERFRDRVLIPALNENDKVRVDLNGTMGFGSSFLEETFGGLIRNGFNAEDLESRLLILAKDLSLVDEIWEYIRSTS